MKKALIEQYFFESYGEWYPKYTNDAPEWTVFVQRLLK